MKTKHLLALCAACLALGTSLSPLHAQDNNEKSGTRFGLRAGLNLSTAAMNKELKQGADPKMKAGYHVGVVADIPIAGLVYAEPGILLSSRGVKVEGEGSEVTADALWIDVPLNLACRIPLTEGLQLQPLLGLNLSFGLDNKVESSDGTPEEGLINPYGQNNFDVGLNIGVGLLFRHFYAGIQYQHGFLNTCNPDPRQIGEFQTGDDPVARSRNLQFSVGYNF